MRVTSIEVRPAGSTEVVVMSFRDPRRLNPYNVKTIEGLDPQEIVARFYRGSGNPNVKFYNLSLEKREPVFRVQLNPNFAINQTYSDLRDELYRMIASSRTGLVEIQFKNGSTVVAMLSGFLSKLEAPQSSKEPEAEFAIHCIEPMLKAPEAISLDVEAIDPDAINFQDLISTAPHGFRMSMYIHAATPEFSIYPTDEALWSFDVAPPGGFVLGDTLYFSSELNDKSLYMTRGPNIIHLGDAIAPGSVWPLMFPKDNFFTIDDVANMDFLEVTHYPTYWGV